MKFSLLSSALLIATQALGCNEDDSPEDSSEATTSSSSQGQSASADVPTDSAESEPAGGKPRYEEDAFTLELTGPKTATIGDTVNLQVVLLPRGGYKVNEEYPIKFKFAETTGVEPLVDVVGKDEAHVEKERARLPAKVKLNGSGRHDVIGRLSFSVCTEERCLIEKRHLKLTVDAS